MANQRIPLEQTGNGFAISVTNSAQALLNSLTINSMIQSWIICNFSSNVNSIWWGFGQNTTVLNGTEVTPGSAPLITIDQIRQLYELQDPNRVTAIAASCGPVDDMKIPVLCWNFQNIFFISNVAGPITASVTVFNNVYV